MRGFDEGNLEAQETKRSLRVIHGDLADVNVLNAAFETKPKVDKVIHFAAVAYVGESMADPNKHYKNVTSNTATLLQAMDRFKVNELIYSSTCDVRESRRTTDYRENADGAD